MNTRRLYRSTDDRIFAGVAGGLAAYLDIDPLIVRIVWFLSVFATGTLTFWAYVIMMIAVPPEPTEWPPESPWAPGGTPLGYQASYTPAAGAAPAPGANPPTEPGPSTGSAVPGAPAAPGDPAPGMPPASAPGGWWSNDWRWQRRQERWQRHADRWQQRADRHEYHGFAGPGLIFGLLLVIVGGLLAAHQFNPAFDLSLTWPVVIIGFGAILVASSFRFRDRN